jgi:hypothetical protein
MSSFRIRPRFKHRIAGQSELLEKELANNLSDKSSFSLLHLPGHIYLKIRPEDQHLWSPQLHITFEQENDEVIIRGLYGPNPTLWAIFFFGYISLGILSLFVGMWGLSRWSLGMSSGMLWAVPVFALLALFLYLAAQAGQKLGAQQMFDIHHAFEELIKNKVTVS